MKRDGSTAWWTEERTERLKELWADGNSCSEIAALMGAVSRSAIIGKVHRLRAEGWNSSRIVQPSKRRRTYPRPRATAKAPKVKTAEALERWRQSLWPKGVNGTDAPEREPPSKRLTILELEDKSCRWPGDDYPLTTFCGADRTEDSPYCPAHKARAYTKGSQRDFDKIASRTMGGITGLGKAVIAA